MIKIIFNRLANVGVRCMETVKTMIFITCNSFTFQQFYHFQLPLQRTGTSNPIHMNYVAEGHPNNASFTVQVIPMRIITIFMWSPLKTCHHFMKSHPITIKDIAKILQISASTVSRALKDHPDISPETKKLVQTFAEKVKYRPNALALSLKSAKTFTIGIVIPENRPSFFLFGHQWYRRHSLRQRL
ncbi:MAG: helix-turn-helix transcriptional regulator [Breznakibacter sp.]